MTLHISTGLPENLRQDAARLYWQAFGGKLGMVMGPEPRALAFLNRVIRNDHVIIAQGQNGALLGIVGFKTPQGAFADGDTADLRAIYGWWGALWRASLLWLLEREVDNDNFLLDGICVAHQAQGMGVGTALLDAICAEAATRGYKSVRLDVIDSNFRAKALYERRGFEVTKTAPIGPLRHVFGFSSATTMVRRL